MIRAALVSPDQVHIVWDQVVPYMERAAEYMVTAWSTLVERMDRARLRPVPRSDEAAESW